jgi:hypothetical protein
MTNQDRNWYNAWLSIGTAGAWYCIHGQDCDPMSFIDLTNPDLKNPMNNNWENALLEGSQLYFKAALAYMCGYHEWYIDTWKE